MRKDLTRKKGNNFKHGFTLGNCRPFYNVWHSMKHRCELKTDTNFHRYGARGIRVLWNSFDEFKNDMYKSYLEHKKENKYTSIDRINVNGNYCKENCRWATRKEQNRNQRTSKFITYKNQTKLFTDWVELLGIKSNTLSMRLCKYKWSIDRALETPIRKYGN